MVPAAGRGPAGGLGATFKVGGSTASFDSRSLRAGVATRGELSRDIASFQANVDVPLASRSKGGLKGVGDLSGNFNFAVDRLSDFGSLTTLGYGANWSPWRPLRIIASVTHEENAPTVQQLGAPFFVENLFNGAMLILAVGLAGYTQRRRERRIAAAAAERR